MLLFNDFERALKNQGFWSIPNVFGVSEFETGVPIYRDEDSQITKMKILGKRPVLQSPL